MKTSTTPLSQQDLALNSVGLQTVFPGLKLGSQSNTNQSKPSPKDSFPSAGL